MAKALAPDEEVLDRNRFPDEPPEIAGAPGMKTVRTVVHPCLERAIVTTDPRRGIVLCQCDGTGSAVRKCLADQTILRLTNNADAPYLKAVYVNYEGDKHNPLKIAERVCADRAKERLDGIVSNAQSK